MSLLVSASQVSLFRDGPEDDGCKRKYALRYVCGIEEPGTKAQEIGKEVDDTQLQPYLKDARPLDLTRESGLIAAAGVSLLPPPQAPGLEVQKEFVMPAPGGAFGYRGFLDLWLPKRGLPGFDEVDQVDIPIVSDFKTTSDLKWAKTPEKLSVDVQAQIYATWAMWHTKARVVDLVWIYFQTRGAKKAKRVHLRVDAAHVYQQFLNIHATGKEIHALRTRALNELGNDAGTKTDKTLEWALSLPPNPNACGKWGGCPHRHLCNLPELDFLDSLDVGSADRKFLPVMQESIDLFADLEARAVDVVGINPPEKNLPLAPITGAVEIPDAAPPVVETAEPAPKPKRGRKPKATTDTTDTASAAMPVTPAPEALPTLTPEVAAKTKVLLGADAETDFDVAWAKLGLAVKGVLRAMGGV